MPQNPLDAIAPVLESNPLDALAPVQRIQTVQRKKLGVDDIVTAMQGPHEKGVKALLSPVPEFQTAGRVAANAIEGVDLPMEDKSFEMPEGAGEKAKLAGKLAFGITGIPSIYDAVTALPGAVESFVREPVATARGFAGGVVSGLTEASPMDTALTLLGARRGQSAVLSAADAVKARMRGGKTAPGSAPGAPAESSPSSSVKAGAPAASAGPKVVLRRQDGTPVSFRNMAAIDESFDKPTAKISDNQHFVDAVKDADSGVTTPTPLADPREFEELVQGIKDLSAENPVIAVAGKADQAGAKAPGQQLTPEQGRIGNKIEGVSVLPVPTPKKWEFRSLSEPGKADADKLDYQNGGIVTGSRGHTDGVVELPTGQRMPLREAASTIEKATNYGEISPEEAMKLLRQVAENARRNDGGKPRAKTNGPVPLSQRLKDAATAEEHEALISEKIAREQGPEIAAKRNPILEAMANQMDRNKAELGVADKTGPIIAEGLPGTNKPRYNLKDASNADLAEGWKDIMDALGGKLNTGVPLDPKVLVGMTKMVKGLVKRGVYESGRAWEELESMLGAGANKVRAAFDEAWKAEEPNIPKVAKTATVAAAAPQTAIPKMPPIPRDRAKSADAPATRAPKLPTSAVVDTFDAKRLSAEEALRVEALEVELPPKVRKAIQTGAGEWPKMKTEELDLAYEYQALHDKVMGREKVPTVPEQGKVVAKGRAIEKGSGDPGSMPDANAPAPVKMKPTAEEIAAAPVTERLDITGARKVEGTVFDVLDKNEQFAAKKLSNSIPEKIRNDVHAGKRIDLTKLHHEFRNKVGQYQALYEKAVNETETAAKLGKAKETGADAIVEPTLKEELASAAAEQRPIAKPSPIDAAADKIVAQVKAEFESNKAAREAKVPETPIEKALAKKRAAEPAVVLPPVVVKAKEFVDSAKKAKLDEQPNNAAVINTRIQEATKRLRDMDAERDQRLGIVNIQEADIRAAVITQRFKDTAAAVDAARAARNKELDAQAKGPIVKTSETFAKKVALPEPEKITGPSKKTTAKAIDDALATESSADRRIRQDIEDTAIESMLAKRREMTKGDEYWARRGGRPTEGEKRLMGNRFLTKPGEVIRNPEVNPPGTSSRQWRAIQATAAEARRLYKEHDILEPRMLEVLQQFYGADTASELITGKRNKDIANTIREVTGRKGDTPMQQIEREIDARLNHLKNDPKGFMRVEALLGATGAGAGALYGATIDGETPIERLSYVLSSAAIGGLVGMAAGGKLDKGNRHKPSKLMDKAKRHIEAADTANLLLGPATFKASFGAFGAIASGIAERLASGRRKEAIAMINYLGREGVGTYASMAMGPASGAIIGGLAGSTNDEAVPGMIAGAAVGGGARLAMGKGKAGPMTTRAQAQLGSMSMPHQPVGGVTGKVLDEVLRPFKAADHVGITALRRGGFSIEEATRLLGNGAPTSKLGETVLQAINGKWALRMLAKFPKVRINMFERGIEYTPGLQKWDTRSAHGAEPLSVKARSAKMKVGATAIALGGGYGYFFEPGMKEQAVASTIFGPAYLPGAVAMAAGKGLKQKGFGEAAKAIGSEIVGSVPQVNEMSIRTLPSRFQPLRALLRGVEPDK